ncbi:MAG: ATP synthase F1 subunit gamma [Verrucomicrobiota bacterium]|nr:ATP synthase F1 subunit gamma [Verrucomicrobiota bacterium]
MASTRDIRRRIKSVKNTAQITKAMQMVAASKMRKAQQQALAGKPYALLMNEVISSLQGRVDEASHPLLAVREGNRHLVLYVSTDKGLCGGLNTNLAREASLLVNDTQYVSAGRKGTQFLARTKRKLLADFPLKDRPSFLETKSISKFLIEKFLAGEVDKVSVLYTDFVNTLNQVAKVKQILPIVKLEAMQAGVTESDQDHTFTSGATEYLFEPDPRSVLDSILPYYVHFQVYQLILDARASEHSARMVAMKNATDNAKQLIKDLTLEYNKVRQASITTEILEIASAQAAMS